MQIPHYSYPEHKLYQQLLPISLTNRNVHLRWDMKIYLHYRVGHKPVLKNSDQTKSNPKQTVKYNPSKSPKKKKKKKKHSKQHIILVSYYLLYIYIWEKEEKTKEKEKEKTEPYFVLHGNANVTVL
jgi:hypothetical protein